MAPPWSNRLLCAQAGAHAAEVACLVAVATTGCTLVAGALSLETQLNCLAAHFQDATAAWGTTCVAEDAVLTGPANVTTAAATGEHHEDTPAELAAQASTDLERLTFGASRSAESLDVAASQQDPFALPERPFEPIAFHGATVLWELFDARNEAAPAGVPATLLPPSGPEPGSPEARLEAYRQGTLLLRYSQSGLGWQHNHYGFRTTPSNRNEYIRVLAAVAWQLRLEPDLLGHGTLEERVRARLSRMDPAGLDALLDAYDDSDLLSVEGTAVSKGGTMPGVGRHQIVSAAGQEGSHDLLAETQAAFDPESDRWDPYLGKMLAAAEAGTQAWNVDPDLERRIAIQGFRALLASEAPDAASLAAHEHPPAALHHLLWMANLDLEPPKQKGDLAHLYSGLHGWVDGLPFTPDERAKAHHLVSVLEREVDQDAWQREQEQTVKLAVAVAASSLGGGVTKKGAGMVLGWLLGKHHPATKVFADFLGTATQSTLYGLGQEVYVQQLPLTKERAYLAGVHALSAETISLIMPGHGLKLYEIMARAWEVAQLEGIVAVHDAAHQGAHHKDTKTFLDSLPTHLRLRARVAYTQVLYILLGDAYDILWAQAQANGTLPPNVAPRSQMTKAGERSDLSKLGDIAKLPVTQDQRDRAYGAWLPHVQDAAHDRHQELLDIFGPEAVKQVLWYLARTRRMETPDGLVFMIGDEGDDHESPAGGGGAAGGGADPALEIRQELGDGTVVVWRDANGRREFVRVERPWLTRDNSREAQARRRIVAEADLDPGEWGLRRNGHHRTITLSHPDYDNPIGTLAVSIRPGGALHLGFDVKQHARDAGATSRLVGAIEPMLRQEGGFPDAYPPDFFIRSGSSSLRATNRNRFNDAVARGATHAEALWSTTEAVFLSNGFVPTYVQPHDDGVEVNWTRRPEPTPMGPPPPGNGGGAAQGGGGDAAPTDLLAFTPVPELTDDFLPSDDRITDHLGTEPLAGSEFGKMDVWSSLEGITLKRARRGEGGSPPLLSTEQMRNLAAAEEKLRADFAAQGGMAVDVATSEGTRYRVHLTVVPGRFLERHDALAHWTVPGDPWAEVLPSPRDAFALMEETALADSDGPVSFAAQLVRLQTRYEESGSLPPGTFVDFEFQGNGVFRELGEVDGVVHLEFLWFDSINVDSGGGR